MVDWLPTWFTDWAETVTITGLDIVLWISAIVGVVVFVRKGWPWLKDFAKALHNFVQIVDSVKGLPEYIEKSEAASLAAAEARKLQGKKIDEIHHEVNFNNGTSVKDATLRIERRLDQMGQIDVSTLEGVDALDQTVSELASDFSSHKEWSEQYVDEQAERLKRLEDTVPKSVVNKIAEEE